MPKLRCYCGHLKSLHHDKPVLGIDGVFSYICGGGGNRGCQGGCTGFQLPVRNQYRKPPMFGVDRMPDAAAMAAPYGRSDDERDDESPDEEWL